MTDDEELAARRRIVHFRETIHTDGSMTFDYRLRPGPATSRNALHLMRLMGLEE
jgi:DNA mismatch repair ATPase MutS